MSEGGRRERQAWWDGESGGGVPVCSKGGGKTARVPVSPPLSTFRQPPLAYPSPPRSRP